MASPTKQSETRRAMNKRKSGRVRKNTARRFGSTHGILALTKPNANEVSQQKA
ncbi:MAG: hypothetical protein KBD78_10225 [Oligoflexales bacterium]|nr:hypothetical protein [Oligoflexales bacterium]